MWVHVLPACLCFVLFLWPRTKCTAAGSILTIRLDSRLLCVIWCLLLSLCVQLVRIRGIGVTIVCPGPVASPVGEASTRSLFGPKGPIQRHEVPDSKRMPASRAAQLIANAMAAGVSECWLAQQPVLLMGEWVWCWTLP